MESKFDIFGPVGPPVNVFNAKEVSHWLPNMRVPKILLPTLLHPPKKWNFGPKTAKFGLKLAFLAKYWPF